MREDRKGGARAGGEPTRPGMKRAYSPPTSHSPAARKTPSCMCWGQRAASTRRGGGKPNNLGHLLADVSEISPPVVRAVWKQHGLRPALWFL